MEIFGIRMCIHMEKKQVYPLRYFAIGHSYLSHGPFEGWQKKGNWGMAASKPDADYFHRVQHHLHEKMPCSIQALAENYASYERLCTVDATEETYTSSELYAQIRERIRTLQPNLITVFVGGGNTIAKDPDSLSLFYEVLYKLIKENMPENATVICPNTNRKASVWMDIATKYGFIPVDLRFFHESGKGRENPYYAFNQYPEYDEKAAAGAVEFRSHPCDHGHNTIGRLIAEVAEPLLRQRVRTEEVCLPKTLELCAPDAIGCPTRLQACLQPEGCETGVEWQTDDVSVARIDREGLLTPVSNGVVTVSVRSTLCPELFAQAQVEITGQEQEDASSDIAVDRWTFDTPNHREGIKMGGFNVRFEEGVGKASSAPGTGVSVYHDTLDLNAEDYSRFCLRFQIDCHEPTQDVTVQITTTQGQHAFLLNLQTQTMTEETLDLSGLSGKITAFRIHPETEECCIHVAYIGFEK